VAAQPISHLKLKVETTICINDQCYQPSKAKPSQLCPPTTSQCDYLHLFILDPWAAGLAGHQPRKFCYAKNKPQKLWLSREKLTNCNSSLVLLY